MVSAEKPTPEDYSELSLFPLPNVVLFPTMQLPLHVFEPRYRRLIQDALKSNRLVGVPRLKPGFEPDYYGHPKTYDVFGVGKIVDHQQLADGRSNVLLVGVARVRLIEELNGDEYRVAHVAPLDDTLRSSTAVVRALQTELKRLAHRIVPASTKAGAVLERLLRDASDPGAFVDTVTSLLVEDPDDRQRLLEETDPGERMLLASRHLHELLDAREHSNGSALN